MRWRRGRGRQWIEDRRGRGGFGGFGGGGLGGRLGFPMGGGGFGFPSRRAGFGCGGVVLLIAVVLLLALCQLGGSSLGVDPDLGLPGMPGAQGPGLGNAPDADAELKDFVAFVVDDVQDSWADVFRDAGRTYQPTHLVLFSGQTSSGCGLASSETGPFYCPADRKVYLDLGFFRELRDRFHAPGDFAEAYVIAHEFGHHVQTLLGINEQVQEESQANPDSRNELSVRLELQADCFAGVWAHSAYEDNLLETGDLQEGITAAAAVGDDRIQRSTQGRIDPESFTHGTSEQRMRWFRVGFDGGDPGACDTFNADEL